MPAPRIAPRMLAPLALLAIGAAPAVETAGAALVTDTAGLERAFAAARSGGEIRLAPGRYAAARLAGRGFGVPVRIVSADPARPATVSSIFLDSVSGVTLANLSFDGRGGLANRYELMIGNSRRVRVEGARFNDPPRARLIDSGIMVRDSDNVVVTGSTFTRLWHGISFLSSSRVSLSRNEFDGIQTDAMRGGGTSDLTIAENVCTRFRPWLGDHPDCIQLWSTNETARARNIVIRDNLAVRGRGGYPMQGVFVRDTYLRLPFENLTVRGNLTIGLQYNAIAVNGARAPRILANEVIAYRDIKSYVIVRHTSDAELSGNSSMLYLLLQNARLRNGRNRTIAIDDRGAKRIIGWLDARPAMRDAAGPILRELVEQARTL